MSSPITLAESIDGGLEKALQEGNEVDRWKRLLAAILFKTGPVTITASEMSAADRMFSLDFAQDHIKKTISIRVRST